MARILIIDDKPSMRKMLKTNFELEGYEVVAVKSAEDALDVLKEGDISLIISDLKMGGMSGIEFLKKIRIEDSNVPFILMTAYAKVNDAIEAMKLGITDFIEKPFEVDFLLYKVKQILKVTEFKNSTNMKSFFNDFNVDLDIIGESKAFKKIVNIVEKVFIKCF